MRILAIDTSGTASVAVFDTQASNPVLASVSLTDTRHHAELLSTLVQKALSQAGIPQTSLSAIAAGVGPAPFTGLRAGLVTARVLAQALEIPAIGVGSLEALARAALDVLPPGATALPVTDARRSEVYWGVFRAQGPDDVECLQPATVSDPSQVAAALENRPAQVFGAGAQLYAQLLAPAPGLPTHVDAAVLARMAVKRLREGKDENQLAQSLTPLYLRRPDVHLGGGKKRVNA